MKKKIFIHLGPIYKRKRNWRKKFTLSLLSAIFLLSVFLVPKTIFAKLDHVVIHETRCKHSTKLCDRLKSTYDYHVTYKEHIIYFNWSKFADPKNPTDAEKQARLKAVREIGKKIDQGIIKKKAITVVPTLGNFPCFDAEECEEIFASKPGFVFNSKTQYFTCDNLCKINYKDKATMTKVEDVYKNPSIDKKDKILYLEEEHPCHTDQDCYEFYGSWELGAGEYYFCYLGYSPHGKGVDEFGSKYKGRDGDGDPRKEGICKKGVSQLKEKTSEYGDLFAKDDYRDVMKPYGNQYSVDYENEYSEMYASYYYLDPKGSVEGAEGKIRGEHAIINTVLTIVNIIRGILAFFAVIWLAYSGIRVITSGDDDQVLTKFKNSVKWISIALVFSVFMLDIPKIFFNFNVNDPSLANLDTDLGKVLDSENNAKVFASKGADILQNKIIYPIYMLTASIAILFIVVSGINMITAGGEKGEIDKEKVNLKHIVVGLFVILLSEPLIMKGFFKESEKKPGTFNMDAGQITAELMGFLNYSLILVASLLLATTVFSGLMMIVEIGKEELLTKAKKAFINNFIGFMIIFCSLAVVQMVISANSSTSMHGGISF